MGRRLSFFFFASTFFLGCDVGPDDVDTTGPELPMEKPCDERMTRAECIEQARTSPGWTDGEAYHCAWQEDAGAVDPQTCAAEVTTATCVPASQTPECADPLPCEHPERGYAFTRDTKIVWSSSCEVPEDIDPLTPCTSADDSPLCACACPG